jgi:hypothetical protein
MVLKLNCWNCGSTNLEIKSRDGHYYSKCKECGATGTDKYKKGKKK